MLSNNLQKLVLTGRASYNTFCASGSNKNVLNVTNDRFIIITQIHYQNLVRVPAPDDPTAIPFNNFVDKLTYNQLLKEANTQLKIFSSKSNNHFVFRDTFNTVPYLDPDSGADGFLLNPTTNSVLDSYLIHTSDVSFTFSKVGELTPTIAGFTNDLSIGFPPPFDYGKAGQPGAITNVLQTVPDLDPVQQIEVQGNIGINGGRQEVEQFTTSVTAGTKFLETELKFAVSYPIVNISYVEIYGSPTNIGASL
jgi:hypothetical protein